MSATGHPAVFEISEEPTTAAPPSILRRLRRFLPAWLGGSPSIQFQQLATDEENVTLPPDQLSSLRPDGRWCPEENATFSSQLLFSWVGLLLEIGSKKTLEHTDLWDVSGHDEAAVVSSTFQAHLQATADDVFAPSGSVGKTMWRVHGRVFIWAGFIKLIHDIIMFLGPFILEVLLKHVQKGGSGWIGFGLAVALAFSAVLECLTVNAYFHLLFRICMHLKTALVDVLYAKSLRLSGAAKSDMGIGAIVNLQSNDAAKLWGLPQYLHMIWSGPLQIIAVMMLLMRIIHPIPALVGLSVTVALIPLSALVARALARIRRRVVGLTDARVKLCGEVITGIKAIKLYAWEEPYQQRILKLRQEELKAIRTAALIGTWNNMLWIGGPILISMAAFLTYSAMGYPLTASVAFPALSLFNLLRFPVMMFPTQLMNIVNAKVALDRIQKFMEADEMHQDVHSLPVNLPDSSKNNTAVVTIKDNAAFSWGPGATLLLHDISLSIPRGHFVIVVGAVGSGKTSLLAALLGEMTCRRGKVDIRGSTAYTQQDPWIQNTTLKENILMGSGYNEDRYNAVLEACALLPDIAMLPAGDQTEIGEKGVNLSGGQRHRVALARACYANTDVYLLDDPLSAVDAHVGRHLMDTCLLGLLSGKTRIVVTHQLQYLASADEVMVMRDGRIVERGKFEELVEKGIDFHQFEVEQDVKDKEDGSEGVDDGLTTIEEDGLLPAIPSTNTLEDSAADLYSNNGGETSVSSNGSSPSSPAPLKEPRHQEEILEEIELEDAVAVVKHNRPNLVMSVNSIRQHQRGEGKAMHANSNAQLTKAEERAVGRVDRRIYLRYFASWGPASVVPLVVLSLALSERGLQATQNWWLSLWSEATAKTLNPGSSGTPEQPSNTDFYMRVYFALGLVSLCLQISKAITLVLGSLVAAQRLQASLLSTVLRLPMSFFDSQPTGRLLNRFTKDTEAVDTSLQSSVSSFLNCAVSVLWSLVVVVLVSPSVALAIVPLFWAYSAVQKRYIATSRELKRLDSLALSPIFSHFSETLHGLATIRAFRVQPRFESKDALLLNQSNRCYWPAQCVNRWLSVRLELLGIVVVFGTAVAVSSILPTSAGLAGLALTSALNLTGLMNWMVRQTTELEVNMNSVERLVEYDTQPPEAPAIIPEHRPLPSWPSQGTIKVENLVVKYRPELDPVLKGISFNVGAKEKIGVAGRTGCGKSTLMLALYRIIEPWQGRIVIDGIDIATIGLKDLRSQLALVPQDPVIFSGSVRSNLDPFGSAGSDNDLWSALEQSGLAETVRSMEGGLDATIKEGGGNLSAGQRQLLCMARALLRSARILILDEATSSIDTATDKAIQNTIATAFAHCTVLTIAHRLNTIMASDRVLVLDAGRVQEFDSPKALLHKPGGAFKGLVEETTKKRHRRESGNTKEQSGVEQLFEAASRPLDR